jgi:phenylpropionate dioxygenase-like ring-hydroxylating dioxygenase large terminal subunit
MSSASVSAPPPALQAPRSSSFDPADWQVLAALWQPFAYVDELRPDRVLARRVLEVELAGWCASATPATAPGPVVAVDAFPGARGRLSATTPQGGVFSPPTAPGIRYFALDGSDLTRPAAPGLRLVATQVRHGIVWVCLAGTPSHELPDWPELADHRTLKHMRLEPLEWACNVSRQVENFMDVAHLSWLHADSFGNRARPEIEAYTLHELPDRSGFRFAVRYPRRSIEAHAAGAGAGQVEDIVLDYDLHLPFCTRLVVRFPDGTSYRLYNFPAAVARKRCRIFIRMARDFDREGPADSSVEMQLRILAEDQPMVEAQRPEEIPLDLTEEFPIAADRLSTAYRRALRTLGLGHPLSA